MTPLPYGLLMLLVLAMPVACIAWTVTHEDIFKEPREYCARRSHEARGLFARKFFYLFTCEYCFSHWVTLGVLIATGFRSPRVRERERGVLDGRIPLRRSAV